MNKQSWKRIKYSGFLSLLKVELTLTLFLLIAIEDSLICQDSTACDFESARYRNPETFLTSLGVADFIGMTCLDVYYRSNIQRVPFYFTNDIKGFLQVDKLQHSFGSYYESYFGYNILRNLGLEKKQALIIGGSLGIILQTPKEFVDAKIDGAGFSWADIMGNIVGSGFFVGQELLFREQVINFKFSFSKSQYSEQSNGLLGNSLIQNYFSDYNSHTYWLSFNANRLIMKDKLPSWINVSAGYSANGMFGAFENDEYYNGVKLPETQRYRQFLLSLDIDWPEIKTRSKFLKKVLNTMVFIKLPFPAVEFNSKGQIKGYWLYF